MVVGHDAAILAPDQARPCSMSPTMNDHQTLKNPLAEGVNFLCQSLLKISLAGLDIHYSLVLISAPQL
jgi:hypothetical protein